MPASESADLSVTVDLGRPETIRRLVRLAIGRAEVLVLGGGGWRTSATLGVLEELIAAGMSYDILIGVSAMSPTVVLLGQEQPIDQVIDSTRLFASGVRLGRDFWLTRSSVTTGRSLTNASRQVCGESLLEHLKRPALVAATCISTGRLHGLRSGPAWKAVRASASLPVIFPPMPIDGALFVDGAVIDNVPTGLAYATVPDPIVTAVSVGRELSLDTSGFDEDGAMRRSLMRAGTNQLLHVMTSCMRRRQGDPSCDYLIEPDVGDGGLFDASQFAEGFARGKIAGLAHLRDRAGELSGQPARKTLLSEASTPRVAV